MARSSAAIASGEISATNNEEHSYVGVLFCSLRAMGAL